MKKDISSNTTSNLTRRQFLQLSIPFGCMLGLGYIIDLVQNPVPPIRPPGGQDENHFLSSCLECYRCVQACPQNIVQMIDFQDDPGRACTPTLDFTQGFCDFCMKCVQVCPTGALLLQEPSTSKIGVAEINKNACIAWSWMGCTECYANCPLEAIELDEKGRPIVIPEKCNGCGLCEFICPRSSLRNYDIDHPTGIKIRLLNASGA